jgi:hypothetical protein
MDPAVGLTLVLETSSNERFGEPGVTLRVENLAPPPPLDDADSRKIEHFSRWRILAQAIRAMRTQPRIVPVSRREA